MFWLFYKAFSLLAGSPQAQNFALFLWHGINKLQKLRSYTIRVAYHYEFDLPSNSQGVYLQLPRTGPSTLISTFKSTGLPPIAFSGLANSMVVFVLTLRPLRVLLPPVAHQAFPKQQVAWRRLERGTFRVLNVFVLAEQPGEEFGAAQLPNDSGLVHYPKPQAMLPYMVLYAKILTTSIASQLD